MKSVYWSSYKLSLIVFIS